MMDGLEIRVVTSLSVQEAIEWDALCSTSPRGTVFSGSRWLRTAGRSDGINQMCFMAYQGNRLLGGLTADIMSITVPDQYNVQGILEGNGIVQGLGARTLSAVLMPSIVAVTRAGHTCDIRVAQGLGEGTDDVLRALTRSLIDYGNSNGAVSAALLYLPSNAAFGRVFEPLGFKKGLVGACAYLPVTFATFSEYLAGFSSKRRNAIKREIKAAHDAGVTYKRARLHQAIDRHVELARFTFEKYGPPFDADGYRRRMRIIADVFGEDAYIIEMYVADRLVGSALSLFEKQVLATRAIGVHPGIPKRISAYFNLAFYETVKLGLDVHAQIVDYGFDLYETKVSRGCKLELQELLLSTDDDSVADRLSEVTNVTSSNVKHWNRRMVSP